MARGTKQSTIQYRRLSAISKPVEGFDLQTAITNALNQTVDGIVIGDDFRCREFQYDPYQTFVFSWYSKTAAGIVGELCCFEPAGFLVAVNRTANASKTLNLHQIKTQDGHEPLKGTLYFMVKNNHVLVMQNGVTAKMLERYLNWLFSIKTKLVPNSNMFLETQVEVKSLAAEKLKTEEIRISPAAAQAHETMPRKKKKSTQSETIQTLAVDDSKSWSLLMAAGFDRKHFESFLNRTEGKGKIEVSLSIKLKNGRYKETFDQLPLAAIASNFEEDEVKLYSPNGLVRGVISTGTYKCEIQMHNSLVDRRRLGSAFQKAQRDFVERGFM